MTDRFRVLCDKDGTYLWDESVQPEDSRLCFLWDEATRSYDIFETRRVRVYAKPMESEEVRGRVIAAYMAWEQEECSTWRRTKRTALISSMAGALKGIVEDEEWAELRLAEENGNASVEMQTRVKHRSYLRRAGVDDRGFRKATWGSRHSVCWKCGQRVDNQTQFECSGCGWIVCTFCGACGCGRYR